MTAICTEEYHEALKTDVNRLHRECRFTAEWVVEGFPTLLQFEHRCGQTLNVPAAGAYCPRCSMPDGDCTNACIAAVEAEEAAARDDYMREHGMYVDCTENLGAALPASRVRY